jgi:flagellar assembly factor FliW
MTAVLTETRQCPLTFEGGLAGFPASETYDLVEVPGAGSLFRLVSRDEPGVEFVVAPPSLFFPAYAPVIDDAAADRLGLVDADDALLLVVLTLGADVRQATANLLAPLVVNQRDGRAAQVVAQGDHPLRAPLVG